MAVTTVGTAQTGQSTTLSSSFTVTLATGVSTGDLDVIACSVQGTGIGAATPAGWALSATANDNTGVRHNVFTRVRQSGDPSTVSVAVTGGTSQYAWCAAALTGVDGTTPVGTATTYGATSNGTTLTVPALTTTGTGSYRLVTAGIGSGSTTFTAMPAGTTQLAQANGGKNTVIAGATAPTPGTVAASSFTLSAATRGGSTHFEVFEAAATVNGSITAVAATATAAAHAPTVAGQASASVIGVTATVAANAVIPCSRRYRPGRTARAGARPAGRA